MNSPPPIPPIPGDTPAERLINGLKIALKVPRSALVKEEAKLKKRRARKKASKSV
jgi:hypothetical protein